MVLTGDVTSDVPAPSDAVATWLKATPVELRDLAERLRSLVYSVAREEAAWPLIEELKWGQPSYRSSHGNESTPVRLGWTDDGEMAVLTHCQSSVIPEFRDAFGDQFRYEGNRAILLAPDDDFDEVVLSEALRHALTYRR